MMTAAPFRLDTLHYPLDAALAEIVAVRLHGQAIYPDNTFLLRFRAEIPAVVIIVVSRFLQHLVRNEILTCTVTLHNGLNQVLRHILVVSQQLLGILRQTVAPVTKRGIVIMRTDARVQTDTLNDGLCVQPFTSAYVSSSLK